MSQDPYRYPPSPIGLPPAGTPPPGAPPTPPPGPPPAGSPGDPDDIQFDRAESAAPASPAAVAGFQPPPAAASACAACSRPISDYYFEANGKVLCPDCQQAIAASQVGGSAIGRLFRAGLFGAIAGIVGAAIWYGVRRATGYEVGLIAIVVGLMVGGAVRKGSDGRGGLGYQLLAVLITYASVSLNYLPDVYWALTHGENAGEVPNWFHVIVAGIGSLALPFLAGIKNLIGLLIIGFALWEAWKINSKQTIVFNGPYRVGQPGGPQGVGGTMPTGVAPAGMTPAGAPPLYPPPPPPGAWPPPTGGA